MVDAGYLEVKPNRFSANTLYFTITGGGRQMLEVAQHGSVVSLAAERTAGIERSSTVWIKGTIAAVLVALAWPAHAADVRCPGVWFHDGDRDRVGHCSIRLDTDAFLHIVLSHMSRPFRRYSTYCRIPRNATMSS